MTDTPFPLVRYDAACRALAEAKTVDEAKEIRDLSFAMKAYARQARNKDLEADATEIRFRAERRVGELMAAQRNVGLLAPGHPWPQNNGFAPDPLKPITLAEMGIDKGLAQRGRILARLDKAKFESTVADARDAVQRAVRNVIRAAQQQQERADGYETRILDGCTLAELDALIASGYRAGVQSADPPWLFEGYSGKGSQRSAERYYDTPPREWLLKEWAPRVEALAAKDCGLFMWNVCPLVPEGLELIKACGFTYKTRGFCWEKTNADGSPFMGGGFYTRSNTEDCMLATRGAPERRDKGVRQLIRTVVLDEHSEKPAEAYLRMRRLFDGPYLEHFGRGPREFFTVWGNEISRAEFMRMMMEAAE